MGMSSSAATRILIIDDDRKLCLLLKDYLEPLGYRVSAAHTGMDGLEKAASGDFDAIILDVMMPGMDGFEVLKMLRKKSDVPVLMLTSRGDETDRIVGLEMGADDYLPKTFSTRELLARLRAVTRRSGRTEAGKDAKRNDGPRRFGPLSLDPGSRSATMDGRMLDLTPTEYAILECLTGSAGVVLTRDRLLEFVSGRDYDVYDRSIDVHVSSLRRKLGDDPRDPRFIRTVRSAGYLFLDPGKGGG
ncbi:MAG: response regulator transcription factor [Deltaproteobacteria bacterium]|nr:response regulator transcription factor [Deltaproteobacteria bacterium]